MLRGLVTRKAPVAQLDRALVYGTKGRKFESSRARSKLRSARRALRGAGAGTSGARDGSRERRRARPRDDAGRAGRTRGDAGCRVGALARSSSGGRGRGCARRPSARARARASRGRPARARASRRAPGSRRPGLDQHHHDPEMPGHGRVEERRRPALVQAVGVGAGIERRADAREIPLGDEQGQVVWGHSPASLLTRSLSSSSLERRSTPETLVRAR